MKRSTDHLDGLDPLDLAAAILAELGNPTDAQIAAWVAEADTVQTAALAELIRTLDRLDTSDSTAALLDALESPQPLDGLGESREIAALLDSLDQPRAFDVDDDAAALLDALESPGALAEREAELQAINKRRERIIRKHYGRER